MIVFWVVTSLVAGAGFTFVVVKYGKYGALSSFCIWLSVIWAFLGAGTTSYNCSNGLQLIC